MFDKETCARGIVLLVIIMAFGSDAFACGTKLNEPTSIKTWGVK